MESSETLKVDSRSLATITVCFNPDTKLLFQQLAAIPDDSIKVLVDNNSAKFSYLTDIKDLYSNVVLLKNTENLGLAKAINLGARHIQAQYPEIKFILLFDQDSIPRPGSIQRLLSSFVELTLNAPAVGAVGPLLADPVTGLNHGFHLLKGIFWRRIYPQNGATDPLPITNLNGSGTLTNLANFNEMGGLDESLFIDHLDTEWSFRMLSRGYSLWGIPDAVFDHRMGDSSLRFWFLKWHIWPWRSPERHFYLYRNTFSLMRRGYIPVRWKFWAFIKAGLTFCVYLLFDSRRWKQVSGMLTGIKKAIVQ